MSEKEQVCAMSNALRDAMPVRVAITNIRKDGTEFLNVISLHPVFDHNSKYSFVIGVQFEMTSNTVCGRSFQLVDQLLSLMAIVLK
jgi:hypothetical protein